MTMEKSEVMLALIERLTEEVTVARGQSLDITIKLLEMAILDLRVQVYGITNDELQFITEYIGERAFRVRN